MVASNAGVSLLLYAIVATVRMIRQDACWLRLSGHMGGHPQWLGLYLDDPSRVPERLHRSVAAIGPFAPPAGTPSLPHPELQPYTTHAGPYATLLHRGPYDAMHASYRWLLGQWLPHSDYDAADGPLIEEYLNNPRDTAPSELLTRIHLPLRMV